MFKIPHTEKAVYNGQGKPDCDQVEVNIFITIWSKILTHTLAVDLCKDQRQ